MTHIILYGFPLSSNTHRVRLLLALLGVPFEERTIDLLAGEHRGYAFTTINPRQSVPALEVDGTILNESYAIMLFIAQRFGGDAGEQWWPGDPLDQARVASWMFYTANELHNGIGLARNERAFGRPGGGEFAIGRGRRSLALLELHLVERDYLELGRPTLADLSVYPFVAVAPEAGLPLGDYPAILRWVERLARLPDFQPMPMLKDMHR